MTAPIAPGEGHVVVLQQRHEGVGVVRLLEVGAVADRHGQRQDHALAMIDAGDRHAQHAHEGLLGAVVGMLAPADVGEQAGRLAQPPARFVIVARTAARSSCRAHR